MEIRCNQCQHLGPAARVFPGENGVVLVCANCGHENILDVSSEAAVEPVSPVPEQTVAPPETRSKWLKPDALVNLVPEPGPGPRCQKCAHLLQEDEAHCPRCGLSRAEGERYAGLDAPWDRPAPGKEEVHEQASLLWRALREHPTEDNLLKFVDFVRAEDLLEYGVRKLRFFILDNPDFPGSRAFLEEIASSFHARIIVAQAQAQVSADEFGETAERFKRAMLIGVLLVWGGIFVFFLARLVD